MSALFCYNRRILFQECEHHLMKHDAFVPASDLTKLWRALIEFNMIEEGDKILIGLSGGKDSMFLTAALAEIQNTVPAILTCCATPWTACLPKIFPKRTGRLLPHLRTHPLFGAGQCRGPLGPSGQHPVLFLCLLPPGRDEPQSPRTWLQQDCPSPSQ